MTGKLHRTLTHAIVALFALLILASVIVALARTKATVDSSITHRPAATADGPAAPNSTPSPTTGPNGPPWDSLSS